MGADPRGVVLGPGPAVLLRRLADAVKRSGAAEAGGAVRLGLAHYTTRAETGALVSALAELG